MRSRGTVWLSFGRYLWLHCVVTRIVFWVQTDTKDDSLQILSMKQIICNYLWNQRNACTRANGSIGLWSQNKFAAAQHRRVYTSIRDQWSFAPSKLIGSPTRPHIDVPCETINYTFPTHTSKQAQTWQTHTQIHGECISTDNNHACHRLPWPPHNIREQNTHTHHAPSM